MQISFQECKFIQEVVFNGSNHIWALHNFNYWIKRKMCKRVRAVVLYSCLIHLSQSKLTEGQSIFKFNSMHCCHVNIVDGNALTTLFVFNLSYIDSDPYWVLSKHWQYVFILAPSFLSIAQLTIKIVFHSTTVCLKVLIVNYVLMPGDHTDYSCFLLMLFNALYLRVMQVGTVGIIVNLLH